MRKAVLWFATFALALTCAFAAWRSYPSWHHGNPAAAPSVVQEAMTISVYFIASDGSGLVAESRSIPRPADVTEGVRAALAELLAGPKDARLFSPIPAGTRLLEVYVDRRQHAYCDFSKEMRDNHPGGSFAEQMTVFSVVNTLTTDFSTVRKVQILIEGEPAQTLAGHLDIGRSLTKRLLLISKLSGQ